MSKEFKTHKNHNKYSRKHERQRRLEVLELLGNKCVKCGFDDYRALQIDHIYADHGLADDAKRRAGYGLCTAILKGEVPFEDFQILCANCNWIKRYENDEINKKTTDRKRDLSKKPEPRPMVDVLIAMIKYR